MKKFKESENLKTMFLGTFLSAFIYSPEATLKYLESEGIMEGIFEELFTSDSKMFHPYQKKLFLFGLGQMLFSEYMPDFVNENFAKILSKMILMLGRLNLAEKLEAQREIEIRESPGDQPNRKGSKVANPEETKRCEDEEDDEIIENELKEINDYYAATSSGSLLQSPDDIPNSPFVIKRVSQKEHTHNDDCCDHDHDDASSEDHLNDSI
mmetsp:Transcript_13127/g.13096  ORF Transcript_13127/g.13096 Transcript_13127/m.13096 type:complete len:210 (-) Transcript_13127:339-968(-)